MKQYRAKDKPPKQYWCSWFRTLVCERREEECESCKAFVHSDSEQGHMIMLRHRCSMLDALSKTNREYEKTMNQLAGNNEKRTRRNRKKGRKYVGNRQ